MEKSFDKLVDAAYKLPIEEREELKNLLEHNIAEARRNEIFENGIQAKKEHAAGKLKFSSEIRNLKKSD
ncbi:MAG: hypothetical protein SH856_09215 [Flavobacteriales bacterium]|mgnify:CR=1 FL=1|nr:hypothetical protein [Flavobacteriales bacterium]